MLTAALSIKNSQCTYVGTVCWKQETFLPPIYVALLALLLTWLDCSWNQRQSADKTSPDANSPNPGMYIPMET
jgi:hypothetical protein